MSQPTQPSDWHVAVLVPTYEEAENVRPLAERVLDADPRLDLVIVDDASPDGTGDIADQLAAAGLRVHVLHRTGPRGYAAASRDGMSWALERDYDVICTMDGDLSHDPQRLPSMLLRISEGAGLVIGSRYVEGGRLDVEWGLIRRAVSRLGSAYARSMIGTPVKDCTSGFRCYRAEVLRSVHFDSLRSDGYSFLIEMLGILSVAKARIEEEPITYTDRQHGHSKISHWIVLEALGETTRLGVKRLLGH